MSIRSVSPWLGLLLGLGLVQAAVAAEDPDPESYARDGWYVGISGVNAIETFSDTDGISQGTAIRAGVSNSMGINGRVGYRFAEHWALELQYERIFEFRIRSNPKLKIQTNIFTANARFFLPFPNGLSDGALRTRRFHPYLLVGGGVHHVDVNDRGVPFGRFGGGEKGELTGRFGGGLDVYLTPNFVLEWEATAVTPVRGDNSAMRFVALSWGLQYRFDPVTY